MSLYALCMTFKLVKLYYIRLIDISQYEVEKGIALSLIELLNREQNESCGHDDGPLHPQERNRSYVAVSIGP